MEKLRWPVDVFARETNRSPRPAERSDQRDKSETRQMTCLRQTGPVPRTQSKVKPAILNRILAATLAFSQYLARQARTCQLLLEFHVSALPTQSRQWQVKQHTWANVNKHTLVGKKNTPKRIVCCLILICGFLFHCIFLYFCMIFYCHMLLCAYSIIYK